MKKNKLCFVCTGNTCRSPMALFILKNKLLNHPEIELTVSSYGIKVVEESINPNTKAVLKENRIKMTKFVPKQMTLSKLHSYDAIVTMTDKALYLLKEQGYQNVYSINQLTKTGNVLDPYGLDIGAYRACFAHLDKACDIIIDLLKRG